MTWRPAGGFRVGAMRERITIDSLTITVTDAGDRVETWTAIHSNEPAAFESTRGGETLRGRQVEAGVDVIFTVHHRTTFAPEQRVRHNGLTYGIVYVRPVEGGRRYCELYCKS